MNKYQSFLIASITGIVLTGCDNAKLNADSENQLVNEIVSSMIAVKGGRFQMGDFGPLVGERLPFRARIKIISHCTGLSCLILKYQKIK